MGPRLSGVDSPVRLPGKPPDRRRSRSAQFRPEMQLDVARQCAPHTLVSSAGYPVAGAGADLDVGAVHRDGDLVKAAFVLVIGDVGDEVTAPATRLPMAPMALSSPAR